MNKLFVVGLGPGNPEFLTEHARQALEQSQLICGYTKYIALFADTFPDKEFFQTPMTGETERCKKALEAAQSGITTSLICSGDSGVYGMASPVLELAPDYPDADIEIVAGITAASSGAAVLGAPLGHDFCIISLSDLLTPFEVIEKRLQATVAGDFAAVLYNPASHKRKDYLQRACRILLDAGKNPDTVCGWVRQIGRDGESFGICSLQELEHFEADMFTTVFIGTSTTKQIGDRMVTPRGYRI